MNLNNKDGTPQNYFDRKVAEEDCPIEIEPEIQVIYGKIEKIYEGFFQENFLATAKVGVNKISNTRRMKGTGKNLQIVLLSTVRLSFSYIFEYVRNVYGKDAILPGNFIDLGSGVGRGLIAAGFLHPFQKLVGIEYLENLHLLALEIKAYYDENIDNVLNNNKDLFLNINKKIDLDVYNGNFLQFEWTDASFIFANSTCFSAELMNSLSEKAEKLNKGTIFVTFTKKLPNLSENWEIRDGFRRVMSWGIATIYVHRKIH